MEKCYVIDFLIIMSSYVCRERGGKMLFILLFNSLCCNTGSMYHAKNYLFDPHK